MSAPSFVVYYGLRWDVTDPNEVAALERRDDPRMTTARINRLKCWWGMASEAAYFLMIGSEIGNFGWEGMAARTIDDAELARIMEGTKAKLKAAGFEGEAALHVQFEPDF